MCEHDAYNHICELLLGNVRMGDTGSLCVSGTIIGVGICNNPFGNGILLPESALSGEIGGTFVYFEWVTGCVCVLGLNDNSSIYIVY